MVVFWDAVHSPGVGNYVITSVGNYVNTGVGNYLITFPKKWGILLIADNYSLHQRVAGIEGAQSSSDEVDGIVATIIEGRIPPSIPAAIGIVPTSFGLGKPVEIE